MTLKILLFAGTGLFLAAVSPAFAQTTDSLLHAAYMASGGKAWDQIRSLQYTADRKGGGEAGTTEHWEDVRTGRFIVHTRIPPRDYIQAFDGVSPWTRGQSGIAYRFGDLDSRLNAADEAFRVARAIWYRDRLAGTVAQLRTINEEGRIFDRLEITPEGGRPFTLWLDRHTHLADRIIEQQAEQTVMTRFSDYRRVEGVMLPFSIRRGDADAPKAAGDDAIETVTHVAVNADMPDTLFDLPPSEPSDITFPDGQSSVTLPFRLEDNLIIVPISIDGQPPIDAILDSGGNLILQPDTVKALALVDHGRTREGGGGEGSVTASNGFVRTMMIGGVVIADQPFSSFAFWPDKPTMALFGQEALQRLVVRIDFDAHTLTLTRPDAFSWDGKGKVVPLHFQDNQPEVSGTVDGVAGLFAVDTGDNDDLLLIAPFARHYGLVEKYHAYIRYGGQAVTETHGLMARAGQVTLDGPDGRPAITISKPITRISTQVSGFDANRNVSGNIGLGILEQFTVTFDYPRQRIILEPNSDYGRMRLFNRAGFDIDAAGRVTDVYDASPADVAGMKVGQAITAIDGTPVTKMTRDDIKAKLRQDPGSRMEVTIGGRTLSLTLKELL